MSCNQTAIDDSRRRKRACPEAMTNPSSDNRNKSHYVPKIINLGASRPRPRPRSVSSATNDKTPQQRLRKFEEKNPNPSSRFVQGKRTYLRSCNKALVEDDGYSRRKRSLHKVKSCYNNHVLDAYNIAHDSNLSRCTRVSVEGYNKHLPADDVKTALLKHFASCGEIFDVVVIGRCGHIYFLEESAKQKALALSRSDMGGWNLVVKPLHNKVCEFSRDEVIAAHDVLNTEETRHTAFLVTGYHTSLPLDDIENALFRLFSSCGEIIHLSVYKEDRSGCVSIWGPEALPKVMKLSGTDAGGWNVIVMPLVIPPSLDFAFLGPIVSYDSPPDDLRYSKKIKTTEISAA